MKDGTCQDMGFEFRIHIKNGWCLDGAEIDFIDIGDKYWYWSTQNWWDNYDHFYEGPIWWSWNNLTGSNWKRFYSYQGIPWEYILTLSSKEKLDFYDKNYSSPYELNRGAGLLEKIHFVKLLGVNSSDHMGFLDIPYYSSHWWGEYLTVDASAFCSRWNTEGGGWSTKWCFAVVDQRKCKDKDWIIDMTTCLNTHNSGTWYDNYKIKENNCPEGTNGSINTKAQCEATSFTQEWREYTSMNHSEKGEWSKTCTWRD